jgi:CheY-like chemotaxis protein
MTVLWIIDDEPDFLSALAETMTDEGYTVDAIASPLVALDRLKKGETPPDLIITDIAMPEISGVALINEIRAMPDHKDIPIILISAIIESRLSQHRGNDPLTFIQPKPLDMDEFLSAIRRLLNQ